jgi:predicted amidophosphoribosyltransferase
VILWSARFERLLRNPCSPGRGVCRVCLTLCHEPRCHRCRDAPAIADAVLPISYSVHDSSLHAVLRHYKRAPPRTARELQVALAAILWRFLAAHESCLAVAAGVARFELVTVVPSGLHERAGVHPLARIVPATDPAFERFRPLLEADGNAISERYVDADRFSCGRRLAGEAVLLVDDTWTTGSSAQSAAAALKRAGAGAVGVLVIGRHIHAQHGDNAARLTRLPQRFDWERCARCTEEGGRRRSGGKATSRRSGREATSRRSFPFAFPLPSRNDTVVG